jgi:hypothetical protein
MDSKVQLVRIKSLLKKYHPDVCPDVSMAQSYAEISRRLLQLKDDLENSGKNNLHRDYEFYKLGIESLRLVHPSKLLRQSSAGSQARIGIEEQQKVLSEILQAIEESTFSFRQVVDSFPDSPWCSDSQEKIELLEKLKRRYEKFVPTEQGNVYDFQEFLSRNGIRFL